MYTCKVNISKKLHQSSVGFAAVGPSPPRGVETFCSVIGWRTPRSPNGKIIGYDVRLNRPTTSKVEHVAFSTGSDGTFLAIAQEYQRIGTFVQASNR